jgi:hypothetical protein
MAETGPSRGICRPRPGLGQPGARRTDAFAAAPARGTEFARASPAPWRAPRIRRAGTTIVGLLRAAWNKK